MNGGGSFLSRWSRRKRAAGADAAPPPPAAPPGAVPAPPGAVPPEGVPPERVPSGAAAPDARAAFDPASLPPLDSLTADSDFACFLREEVPPALRRAALRRAWTLDPAIRDFVGPADYAWDFNAPDGMPGFSLELTGDVGRLLAQAIGLDEARAKGQPEEKTPLEVETAAAPADPTPVEALSNAPPAATPEETPPEALPAPAPPVAEFSAPPPVRRRHGGALPS